MAQYGFAQGLLGQPALTATFLPRAYDVTISPVSVAANTTAEQTFTVAGLTTSDHVTVNKPTSQAGLGIAGVRVTAANTLGITFINATAAPIVPTASEVYKILATRCAA